MPRTRDLSPGFFRNEDLCELKPLARIFFAGLWCWADRDGKLEDRPRKLKAEILPYDSCDGESLLQSLEQGGFIFRYIVEGKKYIFIPTFQKHQHPHPREIAGTIPFPPGFEPTIGKTQEVPGQDPGKTQEVPGQDPGKTQEVPGKPLPSFPSFPSLPSSPSIPSYPSPYITPPTPQGEKSDSPIPEVESRGSPSEPGSKRPTSPESPAPAPPPKKPRPEKPKPDAYTEAFERFWAAYPRKASKVDAFAAWQQAQKDGATIEDLMAVARNFAASRAGQDENFTTHAATLLHKCRWKEWLKPKAPVEMACQRIGSREEFSPGDTDMSKFRSNSEIRGVTG